MTGIKMKTEGEFGFEPSLLVEMRRVQVPVDEGFRMVRRAVVLGDRFDILDGQQCDNPTFEFFKPHVDRLRPSLHQPIDTAARTHQRTSSLSGGASSATWTEPEIAAARPTPSSARSGAGRRWSRR